MSYTLKSLEDLAAHGMLPANDQPALTDVVEKYAVAMTPEILETIKLPFNDPVTLQYMPDIRELKMTPDEEPDPIGDEPHEVTKGLIHRYPDRVLFKITPTCAVYCRFCFRRDMVGQGKDALKESDIDAAFSYISRTKNIREVILSGGDPFVLSPRRLQQILQKISAIPHIRNIRIHTRAPIAAPTRITKEICNALTIHKPLIIVLHVNHAQELTDKVENALNLLRVANATLRSQGVLLKGINDHPDVLAALYTQLTSFNVQPYYLHHPDKARGTSHFRISIAEGQKIYQALRGRISGHAIPQYVLDIPGGFGKVPVSRDWIEAHPQGGYTVRDIKGTLHRYYD